MSIITSKHSLGLFLNTNNTKNVLEAQYSITKIEDANILNKHIKGLRFGLKNFINLRKPVFITLNITQKRPTPFGISLFF